MKTDKYEIDDTLWGRVTGYASAIWDSWGKDVDGYVDDVMDTDSRSDEEHTISTVYQDSAHSVELVAHLVGSVFANDFTKARAEEIGLLIESTDSYKSAAQVAQEIEESVSQATEQFMQEHPRVQTAFMATEDTLEKTMEYVTKEAKTFATNHPELTHNLQATMELAALVPAAKASKVAMHTTEEVSSIATLKYLDKEHQFPIDVTIPKREDFKAWQKITDKYEPKDSPAKSWIWNKHIDIKGMLKTIKEEKSLENVGEHIGIQSVAKLGNILGQKTEFVQLSTEGKPLGMMLMAKNYNTHVMDESSGFVWYLQSAPKEYLKELKIDKDNFDISIGKALLDTASVKSLGEGKEGRMLLHADPAGGDGLLGYYEHVGFKRIAKSDGNGKISGMTVGDTSLGRSNDGRYFSMDADTSKKSLHDNRVKLGEESDIITTQTPVTFTKSDLALAGAATITIANDELFTQNIPIDNGYNTGSANMDNWLIERFGTLPPSTQTQQSQTREKYQEETNQTQNVERREINSSDTFANNSYYVEDDFNNMPKNHRPVNLPHNSSQPLEENAFDSSAKANEIVAKMVEENGWDNDYGNSDDMGRDID